MLLAVGLKKKSIVHTQCKIRWSDFEKSSIFYVVPNWCRSPIPKFHGLMLLINLSHWPQKMLNVSLKSARHFCLNTRHSFFSRLLQNTANRRCGLWRRSVTRPQSAQHAMTRLPRSCLKVRCMRCSTNHHLIEYHHCIECHFTPVRLHSQKRQ